MKILIIAPDVFYEKKNTNAVHLHEVIDNLRNKFNVYVIARGMSNKKLDNNIYIIKELIDRHPFRNITASMNTFIKAYDILKKENIDIIYERHHAFDVGQILSILFKIPCVLEINGIITDEAKISGNYGLFLRRAVYLTENILVKRADGIITVTEGIKNEFVRRGVDRTKIHVVANGANTDLFKPMDTIEALQLIGLDHKYKYICFMGNLVPWQGVEYLIRAGPLIRKECPEVRFLIVGDGTMRQSLEEMVQESDVAEIFIFTGMVPYEQVPRYINASSACIVCKRPLKSGYSPLKLYEYLSCGKPVIASRVEGFELLERINAGILVNPENVNELKRAIEKLISNEELSKAMGENGREYVVKNHSWASIAERIACICRSILDQHKEQKG